VNQRLLIGIDTGGTFTDFVVFDGERVEHHKEPSTPDDPSLALLRGLQHVLGDRDSADIVYGSTVATNALLERTGARVALITNEGFQDVIEIGRQARDSIYDIDVTKQSPLVPPEHRIGLVERCNADGSVHQALEDCEVQRALERLNECDVEAVAVCLLHSYANPDSERTIASAIRRSANVFCSVSHEVVAEFREYERFSTTVVNSYVGPVMSGYLSALEQKLESATIQVMQSNGGVVPIWTAAAFPVRTVLSGPAGGTVGGLEVAKAAGYQNIITFDMGGTSTDVALIKGAEPAVSNEIEIEYAMPIHVPMVDVHSIGAGGGSIASVNDAGILQVGPQSAGADPGPICYGRGGDRPTITDANLLLGRLNSEALLAVDHPVSLDEVRAVFVRELGAKLDLDAERAAAAVLRIANDRMAGALRLVSLARGHDPRDFALFAFGGAGPLHASALAKELAIPRVLVPARPGITNALGCLVADLRHDYVNTVNAPVPALDMNQVRRILEAQIAEGRATIAREGVEIEGVTRLHGADMQVLGQSHILTVAVPGAEVTRAQLQDAFEAAYWARFEVALPEIRAVLVTLNTAVIGRRARVPLESLAETGATVAAPSTTRPVWFAGGWRETPIYRRDRLPPGTTLIGPAIVEQLDTTTVIEPEDKVSVDAHSNLMIEVAAP